jgi:thioredoxin 1
MASEKVQTVTDSTFDELVKGPTPVLVDFWAEWCMPCRRIAPAVDRLATEFDGRLTVAKMNVDENPEVPMRYGIRGIPTLLLFKNGEIVDTFVGADESGIKKMVEKNV